MKYKPFIILGAVMLVIIVGSAFAYQAMQGSSAAPGTYNQLAQCIRDSGAKFYGAFWCPHCQEQKRIFGDAGQLLPYIECSAPDGKTQLDVCAEAGIKSYPTWVFADSKRTSGTIAIESLAQLTNCTMPEITPVSETASAPVPVTEGQES